MPSCVTDRQVLQCTETLVFDVPVNATGRNESAPARILTNGTDANSSNINNTYDSFAAHSNTSSNGGNSSGNPFGGISGARTVRAVIVNPTEIQRSQCMQAVGGCTQYVSALVNESVRQYTKRPVYFEKACSRYALCMCWCVRDGIHRVCVGVCETACSRYALCMCWCV